MNENRLFRMPVFGKNHLLFNRLLAAALAVGWLQTGLAQCLPDVQKPTVVCASGVAVSLVSPTNSVIVYDNDLLQYATDNCTASPDIQTAIARASDNYSSFPLDGGGQPIRSVELTCADLPTGAVFLQLWARDAAGNADYCATYATVMDNQDVCTPKITLSGFAKTENGNGISDATVHLTGPGLDLNLFTNNDGQYSFPNVPVGQTYQVCVSKDVNPLNGLSTFDQVLLSKHIQHIQLLNSPYKIIGCDVTGNHANPSVGDLIVTRKLILGGFSEFPNVPSWRFIDASVVLNPTQPFSTPGMPGLLNGCRTVVVGNSDVSGIDFVGMKSGDTNGDAISNN